MAQKNKEYSVIIRVGIDIGFTVSAKDEKTAMEKAEKALRQGVKRAGGCWNENFTGAFYDQCLDQAEVLTVENLTDPDGDEY